jgi:hypothetical protein
MAIGANSVSLQVTIPRPLSAVIKQLALDEHRSVSNFVMANLTDIAVRRIGITNAEAQAILKAAHLQEHGRR